MMPDKRDPRNARICGHKGDFSHKQRFFHTNSNFFEISIGITKKTIFTRAVGHSHPPTKGTKIVFGNNIYIDKTNINTNNKNK